MKKIFYIILMLFIFCLPTTAAQNIEKNYYTVDIDNLYKYNLIALQDADINCHIRGSIYVGGTLTGSQFIDDGALNGKAASDSYVFNNKSNLSFKARTTEQSKDAYKTLTKQAVQDSIEYWTTILQAFPQESTEFIYIEPDNKGFVDLKKWDYHANGSDEFKQQIPTVYWTNATSVEMGGLAGHLIAPYADIKIVSCNHCGSIVGRTISTDGESHINYYIPKIKGDEDIPSTEEEITTEEKEEITTEKKENITTEEKTINTTTEKKKETTSENKTTIPNTRDNTNIIIWTMLLIIFLLLGIASMIVIIEE